MLKMVEIKDDRRVRHTSGLERLACLALHFLMGATSGVGALADGFAGRIHGPLATGILLLFFHWGCWCRDSGSTGIGRGRTRGSVVVVSVVQ